MNILDIGCGGGLISEPLARLGGTLTGIDASKKNIEVAKVHSKKSGLNIRYLNKTFTSYLKAIIGAEYILRWLPIGTHDWNKFIKPEELETYLSKIKFKTINISGLEFNPINRKWNRSKNLSVNYIICSKKT